MICLVYLKKKSTFFAISEIRIMVEVDETDEWDRARPQAIQRAFVALADPLTYDVVGVTRQTPSLTQTTEITV